MALGQSWPKMELRQDVQGGGKVVIISKGCHGWEQ